MTILKIPKRPQATRLPSLPNFLKRVLSIDELKATVTELQAKLGKYENYWQQCDIDTVSAQSELGGDLPNEKTHLSLLIAENERLRNPWVSVDDELPKVDGEYYVSYTNYNFRPPQSWLGVCDLKSGRWNDSHATVTDWMHIPPLNKE